jgi:small subunit ribosomal protein S17
MKMTRNIGIKVKAPAKACENDKHCPFHGTQGLRGRTLLGTVVRVKVPKNALVERVWNMYVPKYERFERRRSRIMVHNPACINAQAGDKVRFVETRKISKTKSFVIIEKEKEHASG